MTPSPIAAMAAREASPNSPTSSRKRSSAGQSSRVVDGSEAPSASAKNTTGNSSSTTATSALLNHPLNLLVSGWTKLESVPRRVIKSTLELVVPTYLYHNHHHHYHHSLTVRRHWQSDDTTHDDDDAIDVELLKQKYSKEIKADATLQSLSKQIRALKQQLASQRAQRERLEKKHLAARDRDAKLLHQGRLKLQQALDSALHKNRREYTKALLRAQTRKHPKSQLRSSSTTAAAAETNAGSTAGGNTPTSTSTSTTAAIYNKLSQAAAVAATPVSTLASTAVSVSSSLALTAHPSTYSTHHLTADEKEALALEASLLRTMHCTFCYQNQCDLAQQFQQQVTSPLKQWRASLDTQQAEVAMYQMVLDGTHRALTILYPEVVLRQDDLIERLRRRHRQRRSHNTPVAALLQPESSMESLGTINSSIPRIITSSTTTTLASTSVAASTSTSSSSNSIVTGNLTKTTGAATASSSRRRPHSYFIKSNKHNSKTTTTTTAAAATTKTSKETTSCSNNNNHRRMSFRSDGISDLGDSIVDSIDEISSVYSTTSSKSGRQACFLPPGRGPVFTSVEALQQQTLQQLAGVTSF